ncbi:MAG: hypothetical protein AB7H77_01810 [Bdellovibrionales bacterium]
MDRSMQLLELAQALPHDDTVYIDLQYGDREKEITEVKNNFHIFCFFMIRKSISCAIWTASRHNWRHATG